MPSIIALLCIFSAFIGVFGEIGSEHGHRLHAQEKGNVNARKNAKHAKSASQQAANALNVAENAKIVADAAYVCYDDAQCDACYECNEQGTRCVPIEDCYVNCYSDADCLRTQFCDPDTYICKEQTTTCYDSAECRVPQICDLSLYKCVDPTPAPTMPGCCAGSSEAATARCQTASTDAQCSRMSSCHWISGEDADCDWDEKQLLETIVNVDIANSGSRWFETCTGFWSEEECVRPTNENGYNRCHWIPTPSDYDCEQLWPTEEPAQGCCAGAYMSTSEMCNGFATLEECDTMAACHWIADGSDEDCEWDEVSSTTGTPPQPGCCTLSDTQHPNSGWAARCPEFWNEEECTEPTDGFKQPRCDWTPTDEYFDCSELITTTEGPSGCCAGDSPYTTAHCVGAETEDDCNAISSCHWMSGAEPEECEWPTTTKATLEPGCCYVADYSGIGTRWENMCKEYYEEMYCTMPTDSSGQPRCQWTSLADNPDFDCSIFWPTPPPPEGCCAGNSAKSTPACLPAASQDICERMSSCHWRSGYDAECEWEETTTDTPEPGCCMLADYRPMSYQNGWDDKCKSYWTQKECETPYSADGTQRCTWTTTDDAYDCSQLWPTPEPTSQPEPGCCKSDSKRSYDRCIVAETPEGCSRMSSCHWIYTDDDSVCEWPSTTTETPPEPGCCYGNPNSPYEMRWSDACKEFWTEEDCLRMTNDEGITHCTWEATEDAYDCSQLWPSRDPTPSPVSLPGCCAAEAAMHVDKCDAIDDSITCDRSNGCTWNVGDDADCTFNTPTPEPGCCAGDSRRAADRCIEETQSNICDRLSGCHWVPGDDADCEWPTTTTATPPGPGCCQIADYSSMAYESGWAGKCTELYTEDDCERPQNDDGVSRCYWTPTDSYDYDCSQMWPTESPTAAPEPGCCAGTSQRSTERCAEELDEVKCDRMSSCHWIITDDPDECEWPTTTGPPSPPGCCTIGYMTGGAYGGWSDLCKEFYTEDDCLKPRSDDGYSRCLWTETEEDYDCSQLWPTTSTVAPGCCAAVVARQYDRCIAIEVEDRCDEQASCHWIADEDPDACELPTTTETNDEPGCCYLTDYTLMGSYWEDRCKEFFTKTECLMAMNEYGDSRCGWTYTEDTYDCSVFWPTPTPVEVEPGCCASDSARQYDRCIAITLEDRCNDQASCHWVATDDITECEWPSTTETTYESGCCYLSGTQNPMSGWHDRCIDFWNEDLCLRPVDMDGQSRCEWTSAPEDDDCEKYWPTPGPTEDPTMPEPGCCTGHTPQSWTYCSAITDEDTCDRSPQCDWLSSDPYSPECTPPTAQPTSEPTPSTPTEDPTAEAGCCTGYSPATSTFCSGFDTEGTCEYNGVCSWIVTDDPDDCAFTPPPVETPSPETPSPAGTPWPTSSPVEEVPGCCVGNSPMTWSFCGSMSDNEYGCTTAVECTWIPNGDEDECSPPTKSPTPGPTPSPQYDTEGCCSGTEYDPRSFTFCAQFDNGDDCEGAGVCTWEEGSDADCEPPTEPPAESTTPSPAGTPTEPTEGCCYGDAPYNLFCNSLSDNQRGCNSAANCEWIETDDPEECVLTTTTTAPPAPTPPEEGCCAGYSGMTSSFCSDFETESACEYNGVCSWIPTDDPDACTPPTPPPAVTTAPPSPTIVEPGCCAGNTPRTWSFCLSLSESEYACEMAAECTWYGDPDSPDCVQPTPEPTAPTPEPTTPWPTPSPTDEEGCCAADSLYAVERCAEEDEMMRCDRMSGCHWLSGEDADCTYSTTTDTPPPPGCCQIFDQRPMAYDNGWAGKCTEFYKEDDCTRPMSEDGIPRCYWTPTDSYDYDCSQLWPTESPTAAPEPGCCQGDSRRAHDRCVTETDQEMCDRKSSCHWLITEDPSECDWPTTTTDEPPPPGCCTIGDYSSYASGWSDICKEFWNEMDCTRPLTDDGYSRCIWTETEENYDCKQLWPTTTTVGEGCCAGDSRRAAERCGMETDANQCSRMSSCHWVETDDVSDCEWPETTTSEPPPPGCCFVSDYAMLNGPWEEKCKSYWNERDCLLPINEYDASRCTWVETPNDYDCKQLWPTPPVEEGCCAGDTMRTAERCGEIDDMRHCDSVASCHWIETDDPSECEFTTTEGPPGTTENGCCYISGTQNPMSGWKERCTEYFSSDDCLRPMDADDNNRCEWTDTDPDFECEELWPTTSTEMPGCCAADGPRSYATCSDIDDSNHCDRMSSCHWIETEDPDECSMTSTDTPPEPGCCYAADSSYLGTRWEAVCTNLFTESYCLGAVDEDGENRCEWTAMPEGYDCSILWPTPEPEEGCCKGASYGSADRCALETEQEKCDRMSICHWIVTDDVTECEFEESTTLTPPAPGCCMLADTRPSAYENGWDSNCKEYYTEKDCERPYSMDGIQRCVWTPTEDAYDCSQLWPTPEPTSEPEPGCCKGDSQKANDRCIVSATEEHCTRMSSCHWIAGEDADCTWSTTTATPPEPGCCYVNVDLGYTDRWMDICTDFYTEEMCLTPMSTDGVYRCYWEPAPDSYDCSLLWPTTTTSTPEPEGCCKGDAPRTNTRCNGFDTEDKCLRMAACHWIETEDPEECEYITTTATPPSPGCCMLDDTRPISYEMGWDGQCTEFYTEEQCVRPYSTDGVQRCVWVDTEDDQDCSLLWPTSTPTAAPEPGCCKAESKWANDICSEEDDMVRCDRMSSCHWIVTEDPSECEWVSTTGPPSPPGCCTINDMNDYAGGWSDICKEFWNEEDCTRPINPEGVSRCSWTETEDTYDCSQLWPTTSQAPAGCCAGDSASATDRCSVEATQERCDRRSSCHWIITDDPSVCEWNEDSTTPIPYEPGCCIIADGYSGDVYDNWSGQCVTFFTERQCLMPTDNAGDYRCTWVSTREDFDCETIWPTPEPEGPGCCMGDSLYSHDRCAMSGAKDHCNRISSCYWLSTNDPADCVFESTSTTPPPPGCCYLHSSQNPMSGWKDRCTEFHTEKDCTAPSDMYGSPRCSWSDAPDGYDCENFWPSTTEESGCCASDSEQAYDRCSGSSSKWECNAMSSCHWIQGDDADCTWVPPTEPPPGPGCCTICASQDVNGPWLETCTNYWNEQDCLTPVDGDGVKRCSWTPTAEDVDCTILWPTEGPADSWWTTAEPASQQLFGFGAESMMGQAVNSQVSLSTVLLLFIAAIALFKVYRWWHSRDGDNYDKYSGREGYIKIGDRAQVPAWNNEDKSGYNTYSS